MPKLKTIINSFSKKKLSETNAQRVTCNCTQHVKCEVNGQCQQKSIIYNAKVTQTVSGKEEFYVGQTSRTFKNRFTGQRYKV